MTHHDAAALSGNSNGKTPARSPVTCIEINCTVDGKPVTVLTDAGKPVQVMVPAGFIPQHRIVHQGDRHGTSIGQMPARHVA